MGKNQFLGPKRYGGYSGRIYPLSRPARSLLPTEGISLRGHALSLYDKNPFILKGQDGKERTTTKLWISDIPLSCDGADIEPAIARLGCVLHRSLMFEKIRNKAGKLNRFLTGRRFVHNEVPAGKPPREIGEGGRFHSSSVPQRAAQEREETSSLHQLFTARSVGQRLPQRFHVPDVSQERTQVWKCSLHCLS